MDDVSQKKIDELFEKLNREAQKGGYHLNPDTEMTKDLIKGLIINEKRYGYWACPCREAAGNKNEDLDIICPCDYRDPDLYDYDACYCGLYVSNNVIAGKKEVKPIPERRPLEEDRNTMKKEKKTHPTSDLEYPVWRCKVCGYLCARGNAPETCPICRAKRDRFEIYMT